MASDQATSDRRIFRRIHKHHYKRTQPIEILPVAFRPNKNDTDGISVFFSSDDGGPTAAEVAALGGRNPADFLVVELLESELSDLGVTVLEDNAPASLLGHAVLPEINYARLLAGRRTKAIAERVDDPIG